MTIGIPGSGKSSWLQKQMLSSNTPIHKITIISPDRIRLEKFKDISNQDNNIEVWKIAKNRTMDYLKHGTSVILDATNVNALYRGQFIEGLPPCRLMARLFPADPHVCFGRIQKDLKLSKTRANVPMSIILRMFGEFKETVRLIKAEGFEIIQDINWNVSDCSH